MSKFDKRIKPGVLIRARRMGNDMHGFRSGQLVRVTEVNDDEVVAAGYGMGRVKSSDWDWGTGHCTMYLYPGEYKYAKQANKKES